MGTLDGFVIFRLPCRHDRTFLQLEVRVNSLVILVVRVARSVNLCLENKLALVAAFQLFETINMLTRKTEVGDGFGSLCPRCCIFILSFMAAPPELFAFRRSRP